MLKWPILALALVAELVSAAIAISITPVYRSTATLQIEAGKCKILSIEEVYGGASQSREHYQTQVEILKSEELARKVVQKLKLTTHPDFDPRQQEPGLLARLNPFRDETERAEGEIVKSVVRAF